MRSAWPARVGRGWPSTRKRTCSDVGQVGAERCADGEDGESFGFEAGGVAGGEGAGEIDDGQLSVRIRASFCAGHGQQKTWATEAAPPRTG